jgi:CHRD domain-containing protein/PEP-CTERM motif-containing protein
MKKVLLSVSTAVSLVSAQAAVFQYSITLDGPSEFPANASPGTGIGTANYDDVAHTLQLQVSFSGLTGTTTASHLHSPTTAPGFQNAGVATTTPSLVGFPLGVTSGTYSNTLDLTSASSYNPAYVTANGGTPASAESALVSQIAGGLTYWNIHSSTFGGGEIRGFLVPVPEPSTLALLGLGAGTLAWRLRRRS